MEFGGGVAEDTSVDMMAREMKAVNPTVVENGVITVITVRL
jgi:hypothetical protein